MSSSESRPSDWLRRRLAEALAPADLTLDGDRPWDPRILRPRLYRRLLFQGTLGAGEGYVDGDWECDALDEFTARLVAAGADRHFTWGLKAVGDHIAACVTNRQTRARVRTDIRMHYDLDDRLYAAMLGPTRAYSCGYWRHASALDDAQDAKHDLICRKVGLTPGIRVLDIGCGWGAFARFAATHYGARVVGVTISAAQAAGARERCAGLPVEILHADYRDVQGTFDRIVSVGMFEHVGPRNYADYFDVVRRLLAPSGLFLLHTIGGETSSRTGDAWINRYIFPHAVLPSAAWLTRALEGRMVLEDWENFGPDYDRTLCAWHANLEAAWPWLSVRHGERMRRVWRYYLLTCAGIFRARRAHLWQLVLSPDGVRGGYRRP